MSKKRSSPAGNSKPSETPSAKIQRLIAELLEAAHTPKVAVIGFVWGGLCSDVFIMFTNCREKTDGELRKLLKELLDLRLTKEKQGRVETTTIGKQ